MINLILFYEFFKIGLFSVGGGLATIPFLSDLIIKRDWYSLSDLSNMIALSESTPGPLGVNMATFAGIQANGFLGGIIATLGLVVPAVLIIIFISLFLKKFKESKQIKYLFYGLRPAVSMMILSFVFLLLEQIFLQEMNQMLLSISLIIVYSALVAYFKWHPIIYIILAAIIGILLKL